MLVSFMVNIYKGSQVFDTLGMTKILFLLVCLSSNLKSTSLLKMFSSCRPQLSLNLSSFTASLPFIFRLINCCMEKPMAADCRDILWEIFHSILGSFPMTVKNTQLAWNYILIVLSEILQLLDTTSKNCPKGDQTFSTAHSFPCNIIIDIEDVPSDNLWVLQCTTGNTN